MSAKHKWSQQVTEQSSALDLLNGIFTSDNPREVADALKRAAEASRRRKSGPFQSAMSMLTVYINRAGENLDPEQRKILEAAKDELREVFGRPRRE